MRVPFSKMHTLCNDFVVIDATRRAFDASAEQIRILGDRHAGIGFDQMLVVNASGERSTADFSLTIYNSDGGAAEQCGNGTLCVTRFIIERELSNKQELVFETAGGLVESRMLGVREDGDFDVVLEMGIPALKPQGSPQQLVELNLAEGRSNSLCVTAVSMGNPHAVVFDVDLDDTRLGDIARAIQTHERFPQSANVEFVNVISPDSIQIRVFERGAGETMACGSGCCAAVAAARIADRVNTTVQVSQPGGIANVVWSDLNQPISLTAPAHHVFDGEVQID